MTLEHGNDRPQATNREANPGCREYFASSLDTQVPEGLDQGHRPCPQRQLCRSWPPVSTQLRVTASICSGRPAEMRTIGQMPRQVKKRTCDGWITLWLSHSVASCVPGIKPRLCPEVCSPCMAWSSCPAVSPYSRVFSAYFESHPTPLPPLPPPPPHTLSAYSIPLWGAALRGFPKDTWIAHCR